MRIIGPRFGQGRVEFSHLGVWGTICDEYWDLEAATVACNALGFPGAFMALLGNQVQDIPSPSGPTYFDDLQCAGNENSLYECKRSGPNYRCTNHEESGVICNTGT